MKKILNFHLPILLVIQYGSRRHYAPSVVKIANSIIFFFSKKVLSWIRYILFSIFAYFKEVIHPVIAQWKGTIPFYTSPICYIVYFIILIAYCKEPFFAAIDPLAKYFMKIPLLLDCPNPIPRPLPGTRKINQD